LLLVAERTSHAATAGIQVDDFRAGNTSHNPHERLDAYEGALMTMSMDEDAASGGGEAPGERQIRGLTIPGCQYRIHVFFECHTRLSDDLRFAAFFAAEQGGIIVLDG